MPPAHAAEATTGRPIAIASSTLFWTPRATRNGATVAAGTDSDLLAGEIDLHPAAHTDAAPAGLARRTALIMGAVTAVLLALAAAWGLRRGRAARMGNAQRVGGAA